MGTQMKYLNEDKMLPIYPDHNFGENILLKSPEPTRKQKSLDN